jgi:hypothetical protein
MVNIFVHLVITCNIVRTYSSIRNPFPLTNKKVIRNNIIDVDFNDYPNDWA